MTTSSTNTPSTRLGFTKRIAIVSLTLLLVLVSLLVLNYKVVSLRLANHYLSEYHTQINDYEWQVDSLSHWKIPSITIDIYDTRVSLNDIDIRLDKQKLGVNTLSLAPELINAVAIKSISVELGQDFILDEDKTPDTQGPTLALNLNQIPSIDIGQIKLGVKNLPALNDYDLGLSLNHLTLSPDRKFSSELLLKKESLFKIDGELTQDVWQANTQVDIQIIQTLLDKLVQAKIKDKNLQPLINQYSQIKQTLTLAGKIRSTWELSLQSAMLNSHHNWHSPVIELKEWDDLQLIPKAIVNQSINKEVIKPSENQSDDYPVNLALSGHLANLEAELSPFTISNTLSERKLQYFLSVLIPSKTDLKALTQANSQQEPQGSATANPANNVQLKFMLSLDNGAMFNLNSQQLDIDGLSLNTQLLAFSSTGLNRDSVPFTSKNRIDLDQLTIHLSEPKVVTLASEFTFESHNHQLQQLDALIENQILPTSIINELAKIPALTIEQLSLQASGQVALNLEQHKQQPKAWQSSVKLVLDKDAQITANSIGHQDKHTQVNLSLGSLKSLSPMALDLQLAEGLTQKAANELEPTLTVKSHFTLPIMKMKLEGIEAETLNQQVKETWYAQSLGLDLTQAQSWQFNTQKQSDTPLSQLISQTIIDTPWSNNLSWNLEQLTMDRHDPTKRFNPFQSIFNIEQASLNQTLSWKQAHLTSEQELQLGALSLSSSDTLIFNKASLLALTAKQKQTTASSASVPNSGLIASVSGHAKFEDNSEILINQIKQDIPLLADKLIELELNGTAALEAHYQISPETEMLAPNNNALSLAMQVSTRIENGQGSYRGIAFNGFNLENQCQLRQFTIKNTNSIEALPLACEKIKASIQAFNPGIEINQFEISGQLKAKKAALTLANKATAPMPSESKNLQLSLTATGNTLDGQLLIPTFNVEPKGTSNAYIMLQGVEVAELLRIQPQVGVYADGVFDAVLPIEIVQGAISIEGGRLTARPPGGIIQIQDNPAILQMRQSQPHLDFAFSALEHLNYSELTSSLDMQKSGDAILKVTVKGKSDNVERPIHLNYSHEENLLQLFKSLQIGNTLQEQIEESMQ